MSGLELINWTWRVFCWSTRNIWFQIKT